jgi:hypothetical protein
VLARFTVAVTVDVADARLERDSVVNCFSVTRSIQVSTCIHKCVRIAFGECFGGEIAVAVLDSMRLPDEQRCVCC